MTDAFQVQLALICELQQIDVNLHDLQLELDNLPTQVKDVETAYLAAKADLDAANAELAEVEKAKRGDEGGLAASLDYLRTREAKLYAIKTNKEYQAALKEVADGKRANKEREDRILLAMEKIEALTKKTTQLILECADKESAHREKRENAKQEETRIRDKMKDDIAHRPLVAAKIDKVIIRKYEFVKQRYARALVSVMNGVCQGCSTKIPPQLYNLMLRKDELKVCPNCQRLLFVPEQPAANEGK